MSKSRLPAIAFAVASTVAPGLGSAGVIGFLGNFDVINDTGKIAHGFEIELEGLHSSDITDTFGGPGRGFPTGRGFDPATSVQRYGSPTITEYSNGSIFGTRVTYLGLWDGVKWDFGTKSGSVVTPGDNCWSGGGIGYGPETPCDHFGVGTNGNPTKTTYSWLLETATPGVLTNGVVTLPAPAWNVIPAAPVPGGQPEPPIVVAQIRAPAAEIEDKFGVAIWVKVFTTEFEDGVRLEDLVGGNPVIDLAKTKTEIEWQLLQVDPKKIGSGQLEAGYGAPVGKDAASIIRRYEFFKYAGPYDPETNEALVGSDSHPLDSEIGAYIGAQNGAVNLNVAAVPEPRTYVMLLAGLGVLGIALRGRVRKA